MPIDPKTTRPKPTVIRTLTASAPWVLIAKASQDTGLTERLIRQAKIPMRRFGTADDVAPGQLNDWILGGVSPNFDTTRD